MKIIKIKDWSEIPPNYTGKIEFESNFVGYHLNGKLHRLDGAARIWPDGLKAYYINGKYICGSNERNYKQKFYNSLIRKQWVLLENMKRIKGI